MDDLGFVRVHFVIRRKNVFLEILIVAQLLKKFTAVYERRMLVIKDTQPASGRYHESYYSTPYTPNLHVFL